ncbi:MAG TPA: glycine betaine ABC transporter substrate-binding protein [Vicinamibacteria bacterium]|nr:glycine betaine ABC transporter substrate-binding protein [Vicinamibacteria bacterium]
MRTERTARLGASLLGLGALAACADAGPTVRVGSKSFTESYILGEIVADVIERTGEARVERAFGLGGTGVTYRAVRHGDIDLYPEYTGTLSQAILEKPSATTVAEIRRELKGTGLTIGSPLGFDNTYALAVRRETSQRLGLRSIGDLARNPALTAGFSPGFTDRADGWPGLRRHYGLELAGVRVMEHAITYEALARREVDVIDIFSTDGKLERLDLVVLRDDRGFFPAYHAVLLVREDFIRRFPRSWQALEARLAGRIDDRRMSRLNARADLDGRTVPQVAAEFLGTVVSGGAAERRLLAEVLDLTPDHLFLVLASLAVAVLLGVPLGIVAARHRALGQAELATVGVLQTIPSLALLCFMIPLFGIGTVPALVALSVYALLPIVRTTYTGLISVERQLLEIAGVLGLSRWQRLVRIEVPLSSLHIMAGIKTSAVWTVGTATLAAFIGGGGYGDLIVRGLALDDTSLILAGAVPAALMALVIHALFELLDHAVIPKGLRRSLSRGV